ncbi:adhesion G-protein coupled receptor D1-like [Montipora capricornis]|uniref:adhesion G-protein coupled receptor D1-like n=1 Tax=Montipora capricornis TaxID=246305 RepID=UPI0035F1973F
MEILTLLSLSSSSNQMVEHPGKSEVVKIGIQRSLKDSNELKIFIHDHRPKEITISWCRAVKITLWLLKNIRKIQHVGLKTNILLRFNKLEKFAFNYARFQRRFRAKITNSTEEISIQDEELELFVCHHFFVSVLQVLRIPADYNRSVVFRPHGTNITRSLTQNDENFIKLPSILFGTQERYTVCMWHNNVTGLLPRQANRIKDRKNVRIGSQIMSCSLSPKVTSVFADHVTFKLQNKKDSIKEKSDCVFWNFSISSRFNGAWSSEGCTLVEDSTETTTCDCNHLTNFAVLMEVGETEIPSNDKFALEIVTYVGTSFSLLGEVISISVYLFLLNVKSMQTHIRLNMVVCLAIAQVVFLTGITAIEQKTLCLSVAIAINYFYLVAFGWMVMEGVMLYLKVVNVFNVNTSRKYFYGFAWGFPTLLVTCAVAINTLIHGSMNTSMREDVCWFSFSHGFVWAFVGPVLVACLFNLAILSCVVVEILKLKDMPGTTDTNTIRQSLKACAVLSPLLGFTWMFGVLTVSTTAGLVFQYMFTILNSFQGFFIFAFHIVFNKETMTAWETRKKKWEIAWSPSLGNAKAKSSPGEDRLPQLKERQSSRLPRFKNKTIPEEQDNDNLAPDLMNR